jgi:hypothetical protein
VKLLKPKWYEKNTQVCEICAVQIKTHNSRKAKILCLNASKYRNKLVLQNKKKSKNVEIFNDSFVFFCTTQEKFILEETKSEICVNFYMGSQYWFKFFADVITVVII